MEVKKSLLAGNNIATALKKLNLYNERFSILITAGEEKWISIRKIYYRFQNIKTRFWNID